MASTCNSPDPSASVDVILRWLDDLHASQARLNDWIGLEHGQRAAWLEDEGYSDCELKRSLAAMAVAEGVDAALCGAVERFLLRGEAIPEPLHPHLTALLLEQLRRLESISGGSGLGPSLSSTSLLGPHLLADYRSANAAASRAEKLLHEAQDTRLGQFIEAVGGLDDKVAKHLSNQVDGEVLRAHTALDQLASPMDAFKKSEQIAYDDRKQHFIQGKEDQAITVESEEIAKAANAKANGKKPIDKDYKAEKEKVAEAHPVLATIAKDDKAYFTNHYLATVQANLEIKPSFTVARSGSSLSVSLNYDWDGTRGSVKIDGATANAVLDPALGALNRLTARALWSARQAATIANLETQKLPAWQAQLSTAHPKLSGLLFHPIHTTFPKAKLPTSFHQLTQQTQAGASALRAREKRAERHGVTLLSLQRRWDVKKLQKTTLLQRFPDPIHQLVHFGTTLRSALLRQLQHMALAVLVADVHKQLAATSKANAFASTHAARLADLRTQLAHSTTTINFSDQNVDLNWKLGDGVHVSRNSKNPKAATSTDPTLTLEATSSSNSQDSLELSATYIPGKTGARVSTDYYTSQEGGKERAGGNSYTLPNASQEKQKRVEAFGHVELQDYEASLRSTSQRATAAQRQKHPGLGKHTRLDTLDQRMVKNAETIHKALHDISIDRQIEARIKPHYGSLRAQKLLLSQLQQDRTKYVSDASQLQRIHNTEIHLFAERDLHEWRRGVEIDKTDIAAAKQIYATKPFSIEKDSTGHGYQIVQNGPRKDYWQKLTEKQRYRMFNPIYHSEKIFYTSERSAFLAGAGAYNNLRRDGASKKMARLGASATFFNTLLINDKILFTQGQKSAELAYAPFILRRQLHLAKRVVHLNRHHFAWRLRLSWKIRRDEFLYKQVNRYETYMNNNKFTGFHPFHRIARKSMNIFKTTWHFVVHPIMHRLNRVILGEVSIFSPKAAAYVAAIGSTLFNSVKYLAYHVVKGLWHLPEHLYDHTKYFGKQLLFAVTHPWEYRKIWSGIKKDFRGIYKLAKTVGELLLWLSSAVRRTIYQLGRWITRSGANWSSIADGFYHKKLWHKAKLIHDAWGFVGLATLVGKTAATRVAIKMEMLRMQLRRDLHHDGFLASPWRHFVHQHKTFVTKEFNDLNPTHTRALISSYHHERQSLAGNKKTLIKDASRYKINATYRAAVQAKVAAEKARAASLSAKLKPRVHAHLHTLTHDILKQIEKQNHKNKDIRLWTARQYDLDLSQILKAYKTYNSLGKLGRKEVMVAMATFKDLNHTHKTGVIKTTLQLLGSDARTREKQWEKYFKTGSSISTSYAHAVSQDWLHMGQYIGGDLLLALQNSIRSSSASKVIGKEVRSHKLGNRIFDDIIGGFWLAHYGRLFLTKNATLIAGMESDRFVAATKMRGLEMVISQVVHKQTVVHKLLSDWVTHNANSVIVKDARAINHFGRALDKRIHKWERIERIGHTRITEADLLGLQSLHKNQLLGISLASAIARTSSWNELTLQQQAKDRARYDAWISYNQTTNHGLDKSYQKFERNDASEYKAWQTDKAEIAGGDSLTVGALLLTVKSSDRKHSTWTVIPKPPLANANQHLEAAVSNLAALASNPHLLAVSVATQVANNSSNSSKPRTPSLFAYIQQMRHWGKKIFGSKDKDKKKAKEAADKEAKAEKEIADAKKDVKADETTLKEQSEIAKQQLNDGSEDRQQIISEAGKADGSSVENLADNKQIDRLGKAIDQNESVDSESLIEQLERGDIKAADQEFEEADLQMQRRLERQLRQAADENVKVRELDDAAHAEREIEQGEFKEDLENQTRQLLDPEAKQLEKDLSHETSSLESDAEADLEHGLSDSSELLDETVSDIKMDTDIAEENLDATMADIDEAIEAAAL